MKLLPQFSPLACYLVTVVATFTNILTPEDAPSQCIKWFQTWYAIVTNSVLN